MIKKEKISESKTETKKKSLAMVYREGPYSQFCL